MLPDSMHNDEAQNIEVHIGQLQLAPMRGSKSLQRLTGHRPKANMAIDVRSYEDMQTTQQVGMKEALSQSDMVISGINKVGMFEHTNMVSTVSEPSARRPQAISHSNSLEKLLPPQQPDIIAQARRKLDNDSSDDETVSVVDSPRGSQSSKLTQGSKTLRIAKQ